MDAITSFGDWLRRRRRALDLTQAELAQRVGCVQGTIKSIEADARRPSKQLAELLADSLELGREERAAFLKAARAELSADRLSIPAQVGARAVGAATAQPPPIIQQRPLPTGTVTFLFTDIEGSTQLWERHPEAMPAVLARHDRILRQVIEGYGGTIFKTVGDAVHAAFPTAADALAAALDGQSAIQRATWGAIGSLRSRMALHTGVIERRDGDYFGPPLNRIARLLAAGHGGQILLSGATQELVRDALPPEVELRDLGLRRLEDLTRPEHIFQVIASGLPVDFPPLRALDTRPHNLPVQLTSLIGRAEEVVAVCALLSRPDIRLLTLTGAPGIGKTRVGLQVAANMLERFAHGVFLVSLSNVSDPALVPMAIASALGVRGLDRRPMLERLTDLLRRQQLLLVLDNFEHILDATSLVATMLAATPDLKVLITSRAALRISGEHEYVVPALALPAPDQLPQLELAAQSPAIQLFTNRAQAVKSDFALTATNVTAVAAICARLDGLPLAIELAAARSKLFPPQIMLNQLSRRLALLTGGPRDLPARQQTLHNAIVWSYDLLSMAEQRLFALLAVFVGGCTFKAAEAVCSAVAEPDLPVLEGIVALLDQSLLRQDEGRDGEPRFIMLETVREYALDRLVASPDVVPTRRRHATFYLEIAETAEQAWRNGEQPSVVKQVMQEHDNLLTAIGWAIEHGEAEIALRLTGALGWFWDIHGQLSEGRNWLAKALGLDGVASSVARAGALLSAGLLAADHSDPTAAQSCFAEALSLYRELGDTGKTAYTLCSLGRLKRYMGDYGAAQALFAEGLLLAQQSGDIRTAAYACYNLGRLAYQHEDYASAQRLFTDSLAEFHAVRDTWGSALVHANLGRVAGRQGDYITAKDQLVESLVHFTAIGDVWGLALAHCKLGWVALWHSDYAGARAQFAESLPYAQKVGYREGIADAFTGLATIAGAQRAWVHMVRLLGATDVLLKTIGKTLNTLDRDDYEQAVAHARAQLSADAFAAAWEQGRGMPLDVLMMQDDDTQASVRGMEGNG